MRNQFKKIAEKINFFVVCLSLSTILITASISYSDVVNRVKELEQDYSETKHQVETLNEDIDRLKLNLADNGIALQVEKTEYFNDFPLLENIELLNSRKSRVRHEQL